MFIQGTVGYKSFATDVTLVWPLTGVHAFVRLQIPALGKPSITNLALVRLFPRVDANMLGQAAVL